LAKIHPLAVVHPRAELAEDVEVGPFCVIEQGVVLGAGTVLESHVCIVSGTECGERNRFCQGAIIGGDPQDTKFKGEPTSLKVGSDNIFREYVTIHRATGEGQSTTIGDSNYLMAFVHVGHNSTIHSHVTVANGVGISGHVEVEDGVTMGGMSGVHQFVRIGRLAMIAGYSRVTRDCPPFMMCGGMDFEVYDINAVGLRRAGITQVGRTALHKACKLLFKSQLGTGTALEIVNREVELTPEVQELIAFVEHTRQGKNGRGNQR
jgi:UDP-N-acetylglucosamine acyltransferase